MSKMRSCGQSNTVVKHCSAAAACRSMAGYGFKGRFKLISAAPLVNGKADPNPRVECGLCGIVFSGGTTRQRNHLLAQKGRDVRICKEIASQEPDLLAELQHEQQQQQQEQQQLQQTKKRAASVASSSNPAKQQKLDGMLSRGCKANVELAIAAFFYSEDIPFVKVGGVAQCLMHQTPSSSMQADSRYFKEMVEAFGSYGPGFRPPSSSKLRTRLLVDSVANLNKELACVDANIERYGSTITSDGWSDARMHPILNMLQVFAEGVKFPDIVDTSGDKQVCTQWMPTLYSQDLCQEKKVSPSNKHHSFLLCTARTSALHPKTSVFCKMLPTLRSR